MYYKHNTFTRLNLIKPTGITLLAIHLFIVLSYTFFLHSHTLETGEKVIHSHPLAHSDENESHDHNSYVFQILPDLHHYLELDLPKGLFLETMIVQRTIFYPCDYISKTVLSTRLRGPPTL